MGGTEIIDSEQLRAFDEVARVGSFTRAARVLGIPQSTLSQQIARLEERAGRVLLARSTRHVALTEAGSAMLIYARSILGLADAARRRLSMPPLGSVLRLAIAEEFALTKLAHVLSIFRRQHPRFEMRFLTASNADNFSALDAGEVDLVLGMVLPGRKRGEQLWREPVTWVGQPRALDFKPAAIPLVVYRRPSAMRDLAEAALLHAHRVWTVVVESSNLSGLFAAAEAGLGVLPLGQDFIPAFLDQIPLEKGLPPVGEINYVIDYELKREDPVIGSFAQILRGFAMQCGSPAPKKTGFIAGGPDHRDVA